MTLIVDRFIYVDFSELRSSEWRELEKKLSIAKENGDVVISYRRQMTRGRYLLPRGAWAYLPDHIRYEDRRSKPKMPKLDYELKLDAVEIDPRFEGQADALAVMFREQQGLIVRPPGTGKSQIACAFAAECETRTLILVHTEDILKQWVEYIERAIPGFTAGIIRGKTCRIEQITVATVQTLNRSYLDAGDEWWRQWGAVIADEAQHVSAPSWEAVLNACPAFYRFGFTATPTRADGLHPTMRFIIGPIIYRQKFSSPVDLQVVPIRTNYTFRYRGSFDWMPLLNDLCRNKRRNVEIAEVVDAEVEKGNSVLVLSRRIEQLERIAALLDCDNEILAAKTRTKEDRVRIIGEFRDGKIKCILATQLADEALDIPRLNRICLVHPGKAEGRLIQQIGRALRKFPDKDDARIFDFVDEKVGVLKYQWKQRRRIYNKEGITVSKIGKLAWR